MFFARFRVWRYFLSRYVIPIYPENMQINLVGRLNSLQSINNKWSRFILAFGAFVTMCVFVYKATSFCNFNSAPNDGDSKIKKKEKKVSLKQKLKEFDSDFDISTHEEEKENFSCQGNVYGTVESQLEKEEKQNVWYNESIELTKFDIPVASQSLTKVDDTEIQRIFQRNCVALDIQGFGKGAYQTMKVGGIFVRGHYCLANNHAFKKDCDYYRVNIIQNIGGKGLNSNLVITVKNVSIIRNKKRDYCIFEVVSIPPFKDISKFWCENTNFSSRLFVLKRQQDGTIKTRTVHNAQCIENFPVEALDQEMRIMVGSAQESTAKGDCGSVAIANTPRGACIIGIHMLGYEDQCGFTIIEKNDIELSILSLKELYPKIEVCGGSPANLSLQGKEIILTKLHHRSLARYLPQGTLNIYGSFSGFRPQPRSQVSNTPLTERFLEYYQIDQKYGKPAMSGWNPWKKNLIHMVKPCVNYDKDILEECVQSFTDEILTDLPDGWRKELIFLSDTASVNGLPGVIYIDKINCNSSMGFPWNETKRKHLIPLVNDNYPDGVTFGPEVWERVNKIKDTYAQGNRAYPIFVGHLKDEATPLEKCEAEKTRLFTGGPVDWNIVVRSRLLTFVRLLQKNKIIFESGPGTVCQSSEWGKIREHITTFGENRIIAGDYGKYDKRMISDFVLAAYKVVTNLFTDAGFSPEEVREITCIAEDTAFPVVNVNGDLVEFFGTNPSGHPLTVIINSIVGCLYVRYVFRTLSKGTQLERDFIGMPFQNLIRKYGMNVDRLDKLQIVVKDDLKITHLFKEFIKLFTYGDDNIMGVSKHCDWFNHTSMQVALAEIGVEYTMADKKAESVPFIHIDECSFLKRIWRFDKDVNDWLCPLDENSIIKSLTKWLPSKTINQDAQMVAVISSANSEYFFYGKEIFEKHHKYFRSIIDEQPYCYYESSGTLPGWHELRARFDAASKTA